MVNRTHLPALAIGVIALIVPPSLSARQNTPRGVEVLAQGPIHEAFAQPIDGQAQPGPMIPKEPPAAINEVPPDQKPQGDNAQWIPGYWQWDDQRNDFDWVSGVWRNPPPGRKWVPGHYAQMGDKYEWVSGFWAPADQQQLPYQPPPPASVEAGPSMPPPSDNALYNPGTWLYQDSNYAWRPGNYMNFQPGWVWNPAHYVWTPAGYVFVDGYWDYAPDQRGLLFAPVAVDQSLAYQPGFAYSPYDVCPPYALTSALFVRPGWGHYFYGDYFGAGYRRAGFTPFLDYRYGRGAVHDPLFNYYRGANAGRPWERNLRALYAGRTAGTLAAPARSALVAPLTPTTGHGLALTKLSAQQVAATRQSAQAIRNLSGQRRTLEANLVRNRLAPVRATDNPHFAQLNAPKTAFVTARKAVATPPRPTAAHALRTTATAHAAVTRTQVSPGVYRVQKPPQFETPFQRRETAPATRPQIVRQSTPQSRVQTPPAVIHHEARPAAHVASPPRPTVRSAAPARPAAPAVVRRSTPRPPTRVAPAKRSAPAARPAAHSGSRRRK